MNRMIENYLLHVKSHLPKSSRDDVAAEIEEGLRQKIEALEEEAGRPVTDDELNDMLTDWGHPIRVAGEYLPRQYLIGPATFPVFWLWLKALAIIFGAMFMVQLIIIVATGSWTRVPANFIQTLWGLAAWASILTAFFAVLDEKGMQFFNAFDARALPERPASKLKPGQPITRFESAFGAIFSIVFLVWWCSAFGLLPLAPWMTDGQFGIVGYQIGLGANAEPFFYPIAVALLIAIAISVRNFLRPYWTRPVLAAGLLMNLVSIAILGWLLRTPDVFTLTVPDTSFNAEGLRSLIPGMRAATRIALYIVIFFKAIGTLADAVRLMRYRT